MMFYKLFALYWINMINTGNPMRQAAVNSYEGIRP